MMSPARGTWFVCLLALLLLSCTDSEQQRRAASQKYYFLEALRQVETGGQRLQSAGISQQSVTEALGMLDEGLKLAFQVERSFLDELDLRLGKNFERYFVKGVENYRLGIEAGDEAQQRDGLQRLARWSDFWGREQTAILARLEPD